MVALTTEGKGIPTSTITCCKLGIIISYFFKVYAAGLNNFGQCGSNGSQALDDENRLLSRMHSLSDSINHVRERETAHFQYSVLSPSSGCVWT